MNIPPVLSPDVVQRSRQDPCCFKVVGNFFSVSVYPEENMHRKKIETTGGGSVGTA